MLLVVAETIPCRPQALVVGAGLTGCLAALALARAGWLVVVVDLLQREALVSRQRAYALSQSSLALFQHLELTPALAPHLWGFERLTLRANQGSAQTHFHWNDLSTHSHWNDLSGDAPPPIGWIAEHRPMMSVLLHHLEQNPHITLQLGSSFSPARGSHGWQQGWDLVVAADGHRSLVRQAMGVGCWGWTYDQSCITVHVRLRGVDPTMAWEVFRGEGPLALLPMGKESTQVVWSTSRARGAALVAGEPQVFSQALAHALPPGVELMTVLNRPQAFPVALGLAQRLHQGNVLFLGEAAHYCHPLGGQGLNLCWRDVSHLYAMGDKVGKGERPVTWLLRTYGRRRAFDTMATLLATDGLLRLFANSWGLLNPLRWMALKLLRHSGPLRSLVLRPMAYGWGPFAMPQGFNHGSANSGRAHPGSDAGGQRGAPVPR